MELIIASVITFVLLVALAFFTHWILKLRTVVPTNMVHIVQSRLGAISYGRNNAVAGNVYYAWPSWIPKIGLSVIQLPESVININLKDYEAYDTNRTPFVVDIAAFVRINDSSTAAQRMISQQALEVQLEKVIQGAVRRILATNTLQQIMEARSELGAQFTSEVEVGLKEWGVTTVKMIEFMDIRDSKDSHVIENIMRKEVSRIDRESRIAVAENERAAETAEIDKIRDIELRTQENLQLVGIRTASQEKEVGLERERSQQAIQEEAAITAEKVMGVQRIQTVREAEINKEAQSIQAEMERTVKVVAAQANKEKVSLDAQANQEMVVIEAKANKEAVELKAAANLVATLRHSEGVAAQGAAEATAQQQMLMAPVTAQIALAEKIGSDKGYQDYLITIERVKADRDVGIEMAAAMTAAKMTIVSNSGDIQSGAGSIMDMFSSKGGSKLSGLLSTLNGTEDGKKLIDGLTQRLAGSSATAVD